MNITMTGPEVEALESDALGRTIAYLATTGQPVNLIGRYGKTYRWYACRDLDVVPHHANRADCLDVEPGDLTVSPPADAR